MKHLLRKLHLGGGHDDHVDGARTPEARAADGTGSGAGRAGHAESAAASSDQRLSPASAISGWLGRQLPSMAYSQLGGGGSVRPGRESVASAVVEGIRSGGTLAGTNSGVGSFGVASSDVDYQSLEEEYQVQLAMAISASNNEQNVDPEMLEIEAVKRISLGLSPSTAAVQAEVIAYRYWTYNYLGYEDYVVDGFYDVYGITESTMPERMPSLADLEALPVIDTITYEVVLVNRATDPDLVELEKRALALADELGAGEPGYRSSGLVESLARLVAEHMGGPVASDIDMLTVWRTTSWALKSSIHNIVLPLGRLSIGLARHRALLFKVLADHVGISSRLVKGRLYTGLDEGALNIVKGDDDREYIVDLVGDPGTLIPLDVPGSLNLLELSTLNATFATIGSESRQDDGVSSTESHGEESRTSRMSISRTAETSNNLTYQSRSKTAQPLGPLESGPTASQLVGIDKNAPQGMATLDLKSGSGYLSGSIEDSELRSSGTQTLSSPTSHRRSSSWTEELGPLEVLQVKDISGTMIKVKPQPVNADGMEDSSLVGQPRHDTEACHEKNSLECLVDCSAFPTSSCPVYTVEEGFLQTNAADASTRMAVGNIKHKSDMGVELAYGATTVAPSVVTKDMREKSGTTAFSSSNKFEATGEGGRTAIPGCLYSQESVIDDVAEWEILWEDIVIGERIGLGSYGEVYRGDWHGSEVAVKKFLDQDLSGDALEEFRSEVRIMRRLRHPNVVLFMGAVTRAPNLSIVTEFLPRGSLYRLIHRPNNQLDERRRLRMALDVAKGMNYLHSCSPLIVHRDLKSPNLLVDKNWVVKVCDFGLSRMKHHTFLSSKSTAGTPEWMAPEVLRNEPSNEKSDVYSFGVILWELATLQQPWAGMNPMQVVGAVGFQHRRLEIPEQMDPVIARVIRECWQNDQSMRPSFAQLMNALKPLQRPILATQPDSLRHTPTASLLQRPPQQPLLMQQQPPRPRSARQDVNNRVFPGQILLNNRLDAGRGIAFKDIQLAP